MYVWRADICMYGGQIYVWRADICMYGGMNRADGEGEPLPNSLNKQDKSESVHEVNYCIGR
jgi:hypothetical protein